MKFFLLLYVSLLCSSCGISQSKSSDDISRDKASHITKSENLKGVLKDRSYLLFSVNDKWYHLVVKYDNNLKGYSAVLGSDNKVEFFESNTVNNPDDFLIKAFDESLYHKEFINLNSEYYKNGYEISNGNLTYFYYNDGKGEIYGETKLTTIINPNPLDSNLYNYMLGKALSIVGKE